MSKWDAVFRCEELGVADCVVWWDAIAALASVGAVVVAVVSAIAVFFLGIQANALAAAAQSAQRMAKVREDQRAEAEQDREKSVALAYCCAELRELETHLGFIAEKMESKDAVPEHVFTENQAARKYLSDASDRLVTDCLKVILPRLHALPDDAGVELAQLLGGCQQLIVELHVAADAMNPEAMDNPEKAAKRRTRLARQHRVQLGIAQVALGLARKYSKQADAVLSNLKKE
ncbi:hypothetical protein MOQ07_13190 [Stenotrophomonas maltophilia]|nr:hypothetical protein [Stenotrophomonas geniculata]MCI1075391.1 hypothetical protein [Stenotrophomonas maltophilia]MCI1087595.1 hypothetical protein [Stenotrophomonas maltophilia]MCI1116577.1 hypothetical protein [Stenotrophomonas maltophilia]